MAKKIRVWDGTAWVPVGIQNELAPSQIVENYVDSAISTAITTHYNDSSNVHGIPDISLLASMVYAETVALSAAAAIVDGAPATLDTLNELAAALNDDNNFATTVTNQLASKASTGKAIAMALVFGG